MKNRFASSLIGCLLLVASFLSLAATYSAGTPQPAGKPIPNDPAFSGFLDTKLLGDALAAFDASRITDCALLLAHGEKILLREHPGVTSKKLFTLALNVAVEKGDQAALKRLDKALRGPVDADTLVLLESALTLGKQKRKADPFAAQSVTPESQVLYKTMKEEIRLAVNLNDRESLENMQKTIVALTELTAPQRSHLAGEVTQALKGVPANAPPEDDFLAQLARTSRGIKKTAPKQ
ncbi:MAG: hypothetical protein EXR98_22930 [Gemmataceae bacterium]|nr:hypothetical protein [Gemmataceae bacterium]